MSEEKFGDAIYYVFDALKNFLLQFDTQLTHGKTCGTIFIRQ